MAVGTTASIAASFEPIGPAERKLPLDFKPVGTISFRGGSETMATYNMGRFGVSNDDVRVYSALPDISSSQQLLIGAAFR